MVRSKNTTAIPEFPIPAKLWGVKEVAAHFGLGKYMVYRFVRHNGLPHVLMGNKLRFHPAAVAVWWEKRQKTT